MNKRFFNKRTLMLSGLSTLLLVVVLEIWALNRLATFGVEIARFEAASNNLRMDSQILQTKIAHASSLQELENRSLSLGFRGVTTIQYLKTPGVAMSQ